MHDIRTDNRRHVRYPVRIPGRILDGSDAAGACVIEDVSQAGMGIRVSGAELSDATLERWLAPGRMLSIFFELPDGGQRVRAVANVRHGRRDANVLRLGVNFKRSNPRVLEAMRGSARSDVADVTPLPVPAPSAGAARALAGSSPEAPEAASSDAPLLEALPAICDRFFPEVRDRLFARYVDSGDDASAFFYGVVAMQGQETRLRSMLVECTSPTVDGLQRWLARLVNDLDVTEAVREVVLETFRDVVAEATPGR